MNVFLKKELEEAGFTTQVLKDEILMVENFLLKEELEEILLIIQDTPEEEWSVEYGNSLKRFCLEKFGTDDVDSLVKEGKFEITYNWYDKNLNISNRNLSRAMHKRIQDLIDKADETQNLQVLQLFKECSLKQN